MSSTSKLSESAGRKGQGDLAEESSLPSISPFSAASDRTRAQRERARETERVRRPPTPRLDGSGETPREAMKKAEKPEERQRERDAEAGAGKRPVDGRGDEQHGERRGDGDCSLADSPREPSPFFSADSPQNPSHPKISVRQVPSRLANPPLGVGLSPTVGRYTSKGLGNGVHEVRRLSSNGLLLRNYPEHT